MFHADLHIHSRYSRACSKDCDIEHLAWWAQRKGITVVGTGDFTHPAWGAELRESLIPAEPGLLRLRPELEARLRRTSPRELRWSGAIHAVVGDIHDLPGRRPDPESAPPDLRPDIRGRRPDHRGAGQDRQPGLGRPAHSRPGLPEPPGDHAGRADRAATSCRRTRGRPGSRSSAPNPASIWWRTATAIWPARYSRSRPALSSDPPMNWMCSSLDRYQLVSNSDAHSPPMLGREATTLNCDLDYFAIADAFRTGAGLAGTIEFFPEEGKYHLDGHRKCGIRLDPARSQRPCRDLSGLRKAPHHRRSASSRGACRPAAGVPAAQCPGFRQPGSAAADRWRDRRHWSGQ